MKSSQILIFHAVFLGTKKLSALHRVCGTTNTFVSKMGLIASCVVIVEISNKDDHGFKVNIL